MLEARGICFSYEAGRPVLDGADLALHTGRRVAVLGPNGGGKTTLFRLLAGALAPTAGQVLLDGAPVVRDRRGLTALRTQVQLVLQYPDDQLFSAGVGQVVSFGPVNLGLSADEVQGQRRRRTGGAGDHRARRPAHPHAVVRAEEAGVDRRGRGHGAAAARARRADGGLDPAGFEELLVTLAGLHATGTTAVLSTHDVDLAQRWADEVAVVADGRVVTGAASAVWATRPCCGPRASVRPGLPPCIGSSPTRVRPPARPRTAAELHALLAAPVAHTTASHAGPGGTAPR